MEYYWEIIEFDGTVTRIPPASVEVVKRRLGNGEVINTTSRSIPANQVKKFQITAEPFGQAPLIEEAAQAFREPIYVEVDGEEMVRGRWVKQTVTQERWNRYYSSIPAYHFLEELNGHVVMAFVIAVHDIDQSKTPYCTDDEVRRLTRS